MNEIVAETKENDTATNLKHASNSSLKGLERHQSNGIIKMKDKELESSQANGSPQTSEMKSDNLANDVHHMDFDNSDDSKASLKKGSDKIPSKLSNSNSSFSLSSSSDEEVETFATRNDTEKGASTSRAIPAYGHHDDGEDGLKLLNDNQDKLRESQREYEAAKKETELTKKEKEEFEEILASTLQRNEVLTTEMEELKRTNEVLKTKNVELVQDNKEDKIHDLKAQLDNETQNRDDLLRELDSIKEERNKLVSIHEENQLSKKANDELKEQLELTKKEAENKEKERSASEALLVEELTKARSNTEIKEQELSGLKKQLEEAKSEFKTKKSESSNVEKLKETLENAKLKAGIQVQEIGKLKDELEAAKKQLQSKSEEDAKTEQLKEDLENSKSKVENQEQEIRDLKDQLEMARKDTASKESEQEKIREEFESAKEKAENQEQKIVELTDQLEMARKETASKESEQDELGKIKEEFESAKAKAENQELTIAELTDQLEMTKKEIENKGQDGNEVGMQLREELVNAKATVRSINQANSKLEAKLSNAQTIIETGEVEHKKFKEEIKALKDKIKWPERRRTSDQREATPKSTPRSEGSPREDFDNKLQHESLRRSQERIRELEQKVIQVNKEKQKLQNEYDEAVKALEAVDKVYSVREMALQQYKADLEDANDTIKQQSSEVLQIKMEGDQLRKDYEEAVKYKREQEEMQDDLKDQLTRSKETAVIYKTEMEELRKEFRDQMHELQMAQAKARERGKKIQIIDLELKETKETLQISKNVIDEKQKNMESLQESLENEKKNCKHLEQDLEEMFYLKKKLQLIEDEKARVVEKLRRTEEDLGETREALVNANQENKDIVKQLEDSRNDNTTLKDSNDDLKYQIQRLRSIIDSKEADVEQQILEIIHYRDQLDELTLQLQEVWAIYNADKSLGKTGKSSRRRPHSATIKRAPRAPAYQTPPSKPHSYAHRRLVNKLGEPVINTNYINSTHKAVPTTLPAPEAQQEVNGVSSPENSPQQADVDGITSPRLSPRPPNGTKPRPLSSYGVRTYPPVNGEKRDDIWMYRDNSVSGDSDEQIVNFLVNIGDRVLIQSKVVGEELLNVSGVVRFVGKVGKKTSTSPVYVGLKLDQPFGDNSGMVAGRQFFKCPPRHGKLIKMSDVHAIMHPRTQNFKRVKSSTANW